MKTALIHPEVELFISNHVDLNDSSTAVFETTTVFNVLTYPLPVRAIVNLGMINQTRFINKFFEGVNGRLEVGDIFICRGETITGRRNRVKVFNVTLFRNFYFFIEFLFLRVAPKLWGVKRIFFGLTKGRIRLLSKAEILGRLYSCGFELIEYKTIRGDLFVACKKVGQPDFNLDPSYGPLFKMRRLGKDGKLIGVYKLRTMHPYAEYLQDYVLNMNGYSESGKPKDDFRLTPWSAILRRYWLDELPQLLNVLKGEMKLVGLRPISERYAQDLDPDFLKERLQFKPGCIPPYVSLNRPSSVEEVIQAEKEYIREKKQNPYTTDTKFFFKALFNIVFRKKRSA